MASSLKACFARLEPFHAVDRVSSDAPATFVLRRPPSRGMPKTIDGTFALWRRGLTLLRAKRTIGVLLAKGRAFVDLDTAADPRALAADLANAGRHHRYPGKTASSAGRPQATPAFAPHTRAVRPALWPGSRDSQEPGDRQTGAGHDGPQLFANDLRRSETCRAGLCPDAYFRFDCFRSMQAAVGDVHERG